MIFNLVNAIFPEPASDSMLTDVPAPILRYIEVLKTSFSKEVVSLLSAVENPLTPVRFEPSPLNCDAVIIPEALIWLTSKPAECKFCVWNCNPWVWPKVSAVPTLTTLLSIVVEPEPKVTTPTNVAWPFDSIVAPVPTLILLTIISSSILETISKVSTLS